MCPDQRIPLACPRPHQKRPDSNKRRQVGNAINQIATLNSCVIQLYSIPIPENKVINDIDVTKIPYFSGLLETIKALNSSAMITPPDHRNQLNSTGFPPDNFTNMPE